MQIKTFQELKVWQKGHALVLEIYSMTKEFPRQERFGLVSQIQRSAVSICSNMAEGSLEETKYHLILSRDLRYISVDQFQKLYQRTEEIGLMLNSLMRALRF